MSFNFNPAIDVEFIRSMYEDDYEYIAEMFQTTLKQLEPDIILVAECFGGGDPEQLRKQVHKIKPAFGFAGLRNIESLCQDFENQCLSVSSTMELKPSYDILYTRLTEGAMIIRQEIEKLNAYNSKP